MTVYDDFAHHPTAVAETLRAVREAYPGRRVWAVFEPRSASSCRRVFQKDFADAFSTPGADETIVAAVFRSTLPPDERLSVEELVADVNAAGRRARHVEGVDTIVDTIVSERQPGDVVVIMSNGGFDGIHQKLVSRLRQAARRRDMASWPRVSRLGEETWLVEYEPELDLAINARVHHLARAIAGVAPTGVRDVVPGMASLAVHVDGDRVDNREIAALLDRAIATASDDASEGALHELPVCYEPPFALDIEDVARRCECAVSDVIERHSACEYHVFMVGFLPGFPVPRGPRLATEPAATRRAASGRATRIRRRSPALKPVFTRRTVPADGTSIGRTPVPVRRDRHAAGSAVSRAIACGSCRCPPVASNRSLPARGGAAMRLVVNVAGMFRRRFRTAAVGDFSDGASLWRARWTVSARLANRLVGNPTRSAVLEMTLVGPRLRVERECAVAVTGAEFEVHVGTLSCGPHGRAVCRRGHVRFGARRTGARAYLSVGGIRRAERARQSVDRGGGAYRRYGRPGSSRGRRNPVGRVRRPWREWSTADSVPSLVADPASRGATNAPGPIARTPARPAFETLCATALRRVGTLGSDGLPPRGHRIWGAIPGACRRLPTTLGAVQVAARRPANPVDGGPSDHGRIRADR